MVVNLAVDGQSDGSILVGQRLSPTLYDSSASGSWVKFRANRQCLRTNSDDAQSLVGENCSDGGDQHQTVAAPTSRTVSDSLVLFPT